MAKTLLGKVTHYYDKLGVAVVDLTSGLSVGNKIKFVRGGEDLFEQEVKTMQIEYKELKSAKKGDTIGLKVDEEVKEGAEVYKL